MHVISKPAILYFGTPVALLSTMNEDGTANLSPMSSVFWLSWRCMLGLESISKTTENMRRTGEMVINLPSINPVPQGKLARGFKYQKNKFEAAHLTPVASELVRPPRVLECPVQLEATLESECSLDVGGPMEGFLITFEMRIKRIHIEESILMNGHPNRVDPDKWRPLIFNFQHFYGLGGSQVHDSRLSRISEELYRTPDMVPQN
jgi:flavin reductase (DIM6/NTAB) family NADH-FMN oxidoreductase RutF